MPSPKRAFTLHFVPTQHDLRIGDYLRWFRGLADRLRPAANDLRGIACRAELGPLAHSGGGDFVAWSAELTGIPGTTVAARGTVLFGGSAQGTRDAAAEETLCDLQYAVTTDLPWDAFVPSLRAILDAHAKSGLAWSIAEGAWELDAVLPYWKSRDAEGVRFFVEAYAEQQRARFAASGSGLLRVVCVPEVLRAGVLDAFPEPARVKVLQLAFPQRRAALPASLKRFVNTTRVELVGAYFAGRIDLARYAFPKLRSVVWYGDGRARPEVPLDAYPRVEAVVEKHWSKIPGW